jgi:hydroxycarboxylate dehydrogenase B
MPNFMPQALHALSRLIVSRMGSAPEETEEVADHLVRANLSGHDSHGVGMLPAYVRLLQDGLLVPNQTPHTVLDAGALLVIDARRGFGQRMAADAVRRAIARARETGACVLALRNASHVGRIGTYAELAASAGMAFTAFVNVADGRDVQAPWACAEPRLGTNPFCAAVPGLGGDGDEPALLLDMATTTIAAGKARVAFNKGMPVPEGSLIDANGEPTNDPAGFIRDRTGAMLSFGRHKGSGLAVMCEIMAGAIGGGQRADEPTRGGILNSMLATVIDLSRLGDPGAIAQNIEGYQSAHPVVPPRAGLRRNPAAG